MAVLSTKNASVGEEPPVLIKALWGIVIAMISYVLIISGGQDAIRSLFTLIGLPMAFVVMLYLWYIVRYSSYIFGQTDRFERWRASGEAERWRSLRDHKPAPVPELNWPRCPFNPQFIDAGRIQTLAREELYPHSVLIQFYI